MSTKGYDSSYYRETFTMSVGLKKKIPDLDLKLQALSPRAGERILDLGCGLGNMTFEISKSGASVLGADVSEYAVQRARKEYPSLQFEVIDALRLAYTSLFDKVFLDQVLEHFSDEERRVVLRNIRRALKAEGQLVIGVPINDFTHSVIFRKVAGLAGLRIDSSHKVNFTFRRLVDELSEAGFKLTRAYPMVHLSFIFPIRLPCSVFEREFARRYLLGGILARAQRMEISDQAVEASSTILT